MATLTIAQMVGYAKGAGLSDDKAAIAGAIGMAESSGRTDVVNFLGCTGIWQIYVGVHRATIQSKWPGVDPTEAMKDPSKNAVMMAYLSNNGRNWGPWEGYTNGMYAKYLAEAKGSAGTGAIGGATIQNASLSDAGSALTNGNTWLRIGFAILGIALLALAIARLTGTANVVTKATKIAITKKV